MSVYRGPNRPCLLESRNPGHRTGLPTCCSWHRDEAAAQSVIPQTWAERYQAAAERLEALTFTSGASLGYMAIGWANQLRGAAVLAERLGL